MFSVIMVSQQYWNLHAIIFEYPCSSVDMKEDEKMIININKNAKADKTVLNLKY